MSADEDFLHHVITDGAPPVKDMLLDHSKVGWWKDRVLAWERGEKIAPITMDVAWTRKCQAACHFCAAQSQSSEGGEITREIAFQFLEDAAEIGVKGISLISDGESSMVPFYADSIEYGAKLGIKMGVGTNGITLVKPMLEHILPHLTYCRFNFSAGERKRYAEIMGLKQPIYDRVIQNIRDTMEIVRRDNLSCNVNMNLVSEPRDADQLLPFARLAKELRVHYAIIKHCAPDDDGMVKVDYKEYEPLYEVFRQCEELSDLENNFRVVSKWARIATAGKRDYNKCFGTPFILQMSGNGLIAPCGPLFNEKYRAFHIGNITTERFKDMFNSDRYWDVINYLGSDDFNPQDRCRVNCLQHWTNDWLFKYKKGQITFPITAAPIHPEFI
jgi:MoaA/NifB/PqqE/SkfB family radical SAM enzyme